MKVNSGGPITALTAREQNGLREMLFPAKQSEGFTKNQTVDNLLGFLQLDTDEKPRELTQDEIDVAESVFGDMIDLEEVRIGDKNWLARFLNERSMAMTICNTIYGIGMPNDTLIHELVHVWQYDREHIDPASAALPHIEAWLQAWLGEGTLGEDTRDELYSYSVEPRQAFRDYGFEQQASIIQDAYLVIEEGQPPKRNKDYKSGDELPKELYEGFMAEFREWHKKLTRAEQFNDARIEWLESRYHRSKGR